MIVKDSTANQVHNDSTKKQKTKSIKRLRSDASVSYQTTGSVRSLNETLLLKSLRRYTTDTGVSDSRSTEAWPHNFLLLFFWS